MELFKPEFGLVFWMLVVFLILLAILTKYAWPVIIDSLDKRSEEIADGLTFAKQAKTDLEKAKEEAQALLTKAQNEQMEILHETTRMKAQIIAEAKKAAAEEAKKTIDAATLSIEQARKEAELQFKKQVSSFSLQIAEKLLKRELSDENSQIELIDKMIDQLERKN